MLHTTTFMSRKLKNLLVHSLIWAEFTRHNKATGYALSYVFASLHQILWCWEKLYMNLQTFLDSCTIWNVSCRNLYMNFYMKHSSKLCAKINKKLMDIRFIYVGMVHFVSSIFSIDQKCWLIQYFWSIPFLSF
jgi:hypothetical protein